MAVDSVPRLYLICRDFRPTEQISDSWYATQALADAAAVASGADFTAHQGAVAVPQNWMSGWIYNATSDTWCTQDLRDVDDLGKRKHRPTARAGRNPIGGAVDGLVSTATRRTARRNDNRYGPMGELRCVPERARHMDIGTTDRVGRGDG